MVDLDDQPRARFDVEVLEHREHAADERRRRVAQRVVGHERGPMHGRVVARRPQRLQRQPLVRWEHPAARLEVVHRGFVETDDRVEEGERGGARGRGRGRATTASEAGNCGWLEGSAVSRGCYREPNPNPNPNPLPNQRAEVAAGGAHQEQECGRRVEAGGDLHDQQGERRRGDHLLRPCHDEGE
eukprot:scaffold38839_cov64-Phaeocystis_antarctica.AAC.4